MCGTQQPTVSLDFTAAFMGDNFLLHFIHLTGAGHQHHSRRLLVTHIARLDLFVIVSVLNTWACTSFSWFICFSQAEASNPVLRGPQSIRVFSPTRQTTAVTKETGLPGQSRCLSGKAETRWIRALAGLG